MWRDFRPMRLFRNDDSSPFGLHATNPHSNKGSEGETSVGRRISPVRSSAACAFRLVIIVAACCWACSCTLLTQSPYLCQKTQLPSLQEDRGLVTGRGGKIPYQKWRVPPWDDELRYVWLVGDYDFRRFKQVEIILYFHGMHSKDYYRDFRNELELLVEKRPNQPFLFVGFVDTPGLHDSDRKDRWASLAPQRGERPETLFRTVNSIFKAFRKRFPHIKKEDTTLALAGFSGGGKVLNSVGNWLAKSPEDDPYAEVFRSRLTKIAYFDCWFDKDVVETVPALLEKNPAMKIVGTVHMKKPVEHAVSIASKYRMKAHKQNNQLVGLDGRLMIFRDNSHWSAMISRLREAL